MGNDDDFTIKEIQENHHLFGSQLFGQQQEAVGINFLPAIANGQNSNKYFPMCIPRSQIFDQIKIKVQSPGKFYL